MERNEKRYFGYYYPFADPAGIKILNAFVYKYFFKEAVGDKLAKYSQKVNDYIAQKRYKKIIILNILMNVKMFEIWTNLNAYQGYEYIDNHIDNQGGVEEQYYFMNLRRCIRYDEFYKKVNNKKKPSLRFINELKILFQLPNIRDWDKFEQNGTLKMNLGLGNDELLIDY